MGAKMFHDKCGGDIFVDVSSCFSLLGEVNASKDSRMLQTIRIHLLQTKEVLENPIFVCSRCKEKVDLKDIMGFCRRCNEYSLVSELQIPNETGGIYCKKCISRLDDEKHTNLLTILSKSLIIK